VCFQASNRKSAPPGRALKRTQARRLLPGGGPYFADTGARRMTISSIMNAGLTALQASQTAMRVASQNIANANTAGYVRANVNLLAAERSRRRRRRAGVEHLARGRISFSPPLLISASANSGAAAARSDLLARAQGYFGDPNSGSSVFASVDNIWSSLTALQVDPSSTLSRDQAVSAMQNAFDQISNAATSCAIADHRSGFAHRHRRGRRAKPAEPDRFIERSDPPDQNAPARIRAPWRTRNQH